MPTTHIFSWGNIPQQVEELLLFNATLYSQHVELLDSLTLDQVANSLYMDLCGKANKVLDSRVKDYLSYQF
jgi:hypothetical protein